MKIFAIAHFIHGWRHNCWAEKH